MGRGGEKTTAVAGTRGEVNTKKRLGEKTVLVKHTLGIKGEVAGDYEGTGILRETLRKR